MAKISDLSDELLLKILSFLSTKEAVSTSILSKQWEFLWMWLSDLEFDCDKRSVRNFINKNLPLHRAPIINSLSLAFMNGPSQPDDSKLWTEVALSRGLRELSIFSHSYEEPSMFMYLPNSLFTCNSLVSLNLDGNMILVDVPPTVCLPSLKTLHLSYVTYSDQVTLKSLLSGCPVLEDLLIDRHGDDNVTVLVIKVPSLQRLFIRDSGSSSKGCVIVTPSLKSFQVEDHRSVIRYVIEYMPELEEADISLFSDIRMEMLLKSITSAKRLSVNITSNSTNQVVYGDGIVFTRLENLKLYICSKNWSKVLFQLLKDSPNLQVLDLEIDNYDESFGEYIPISWSSNPSFVPECLLKSLKTFYFKGSTKEEEERDFLSFIDKHARCLESKSVLP